MQKTIVFPIHKKITQRKSNYLDRLTARVTYATNLFLDYIQVYDTTSLHDLNDYKNEFVKKRTCLNSAHLQQCYMKAREAWKSYKKLKGKKSLPKFRNKKIPIWQDKRTFEFVEWKEGKLTRYWIRITTLKPREKIMVPLDYGYYHIKELKNATIKSVAFVKKGKKFYIHLSIEKSIPQIRAKKILAVDLGVRRKATAVLLSPSLSFSKRDIHIFRDGRRLSLIHKTEQYYSKMQSLAKWKVVKKIRNFRKIYKEEYDHIISKKIVEIAEKHKAIVVIGYPKYCRSSHRRGNGNKRLRKIVNSWSFHRIAKMTKYKCVEKGISCLLIRESWTSKTCHKCKSKNTKRPYQSLFKCLDCDLQYNADINSAINIGSRASSLLSVGCSESTITNDEKVGETLEVRSSLQKLGAVHNTIFKEENTK